MSQKNLKSPSSPRFDVRIYRDYKKIDDIALSPSQFSEKWVNQVLGGLFISWEGPNDTQIFMPDKPEEDLVKNVKATEMWHQAGHKDDLYGTVIQVPTKLANVLFSRMQKVFAM
jgi:hypothetical protein